MDNATIFQMATNPLMLSKVQLVRFTEITSNLTLQVVQQDPDNCAAGSLELVKTQTNSSLFRVYDHLTEQYFTQSPECCS